MSAQRLNREEFIQDPYPTYQALLEADGPYWLEHQQGTSASGIWLFSRYEDAVSIFKSHEDLSKNIQLIRTPQYRSPFDFHLLFQDGARHAFLRQLISQAFSQTAIQQLLPQVNRSLSELFNSLKDRQHSDLIAELAEPLPLQVMAHLIGIPPQDLAQIRVWSMDLSDGFDSIVSNTESLSKQRQAMGSFMDYLARQIQQHAFEPGDHLSSHLVAAYKAKLISHEELLGMLGFLIFAGHETTVHLIGNTLYLLLNHPEAWEILKAQPHLIPMAIEESLRFESPEQRSSFRITSDRLRVRDSIIEVGQQVGIIIGAANRDPREFANPNVFNILRQPNRHLAFGVGIHSCLGKRMARLLAHQSILHLIEQYPKITLDSHQAQWRRNTFFRGLDKLIVHLGHN